MNESLLKDPGGRLQVNFPGYLVIQGLVKPFFVMKGTGDRDQEITHLPSGRIMIRLRENPRSRAGRICKWREPDMVKVARPVLGRRGTGNGLLLPDNSDLQSR